MPAAEFETKQRELRELKERLVRQQAEFDNVRKRLRKDADEAGNRAIARFVRPILLEIDNLRMALANASPERFTELAAGLTMVEGNLSKALQSAGINEVPSTGVFDPAIHEVLAEEERADLPKGSITQVRRAGFKLNDQLIRAAQVVVAKPPTAGA